MGLDTILQSLGYQFWPMTAGFSISIDKNLDQGYN